MGFRITSIIRRKSFTRTQGSTKGFEVAKGYLAVYVGDKMRRFVIPKKTMGFGIKSIIRRASFSTTQGSTKGYEVSKGYLAVYVGDKMRRFVIPVSYLNQQLFQELLNETKEEFGYDHPMGGLTIPCSEDEFLNLTSHLA
ncbi:hypothetical protein RYX36_036288 [Vicia faba]